MMLRQPDLWDTPEWAITVFEKLAGMQITVHDLGVSLAPFLSPERFRHRSPCCLAVKAGRDWACVDFEINRLRQEIGSHPDGRYHVCHAGFMEWVVPVMVEGNLAWILFAGQARTVGGYRWLLRDADRGESLAAGMKSKLRGVTEEQAEQILEALRQLRARLLQWQQEISQNSLLQTKNVAGRRMQIQAFLQKHHVSPKPLGDLAQYLCLSESRSSHLIKELFGCSYMQLVMQMRLRIAAALLGGSSLSVLEVCLASGFQDISHFHRVFAKHFGTTPLKYRKAAQT